MPIVAKKPGFAQLELIVGGNENSGSKAKGGKKFADLFGPTASIEFWIYNFNTQAAK